MSKAIQRFSLDVTHPDVQASVRIMQGDDNRQWRFTFTNGGRPFIIPARCTAMLVGTKPDDTVIENGLVVQGNEVIYDFGAADPENGIEQISTVPGSFEVQILLFDEYGAVLHAPRLWVTVFSSSYTERMANVSMDQFGGIKELIARLVGMEGDVETLLERMTSSGSVTIQPTEWTDSQPYTALLLLAGLTDGTVTLFLPMDDATKQAAGEARLSMAVNSTQNNGVGGQYAIMARAEGGEAPTIPLNFRYVVLKTGTEDKALVAMIGVDAVGSVTVSGDGVSEERVKELINEALSEFSPGEGGESGNLMVLITSVDKVSKASHTAQEIYDADLEERVIEASMDGVRYEYLGPSINENGSLKRVIFYRTMVDENGKAWTEIVNIYGDGTAEAEIIESDHYTKEEVNRMVSSIPKFSISVVDARPELSEASTTTVYLVPTGDGESDNLYEEWICVEDDEGNRKYERLGAQGSTVSVDLFEYVENLPSTGTINKNKIYLKKRADITNTQDSYLKYIYVDKPNGSSGWELLGVGQYELEKKVTSVVTSQLTSAKESGEFDGPSAYEIAVKNGFEGTEEEWLASLKNCFEDAEGTEIHVTDSKAAPLQGLVVFGKTQGGENLFDGAIETGTLDNTTGEGGGTPSANAACVRSVNFTTVEGGRTILVYNDKGYMCRLYEYDADENCLNANDDNSANPAEYTLKSDTTQIKFRTDQAKGQNDTSVVFKIRYEDETATGLNAVNVDVNGQTLAVPAKSLHGMEVSENETYTDADGKKWLADTVDYAKGVFTRRIQVTADGFTEPLAEPTVTALSEEDMAAYEALRMGDGETSITNDAGAWMKVRYEADVKGEDGVSPTVTVTEITGGHRVTITDVNGTKSFDVMDGEGGASSTELYNAIGTTFPPAQRSAEPKYDDCEEDMPNIHEARADDIHAYIDSVASGKPTVTKEIMGKDSSGKYDIARYIYAKREYLAWVKENYPKMYAWKNGTKVMYTESVAPRIDDKAYEKGNKGGTITETVTTPPHGVLVTGKRWSLSEGMWTDIDDLSQVIVPIRGRTVPFSVTLDGMTIHHTKNAVYVGTAEAASGGGGQASINSNTVNVTAEGDCLWFSVNRAMTEGGLETVTEPALAIIYEGYRWSMSSGGFTAAAKYASFIIPLPVEEVETAVVSFTGIVGSDALGYGGETNTSFTAQIGDNQWSEDLKTVTAGDSTHSLSGLKFLTIPMSSQDNYDNITITVNGKSVNYRLGDPSEAKQESITTGEGEGTYEDYSGAKIYIGDEEITFTVTQSTDDTALVKQKVSTEVETEGDGVPITAVSATNRSRTIGGVEYVRYEAGDVEPTVIYTDRDDDRNSGATITKDSVTYSRYPLGDLGANRKKLLPIVIWANVHGTPKVIPDTITSETVATVVETKMCALIAARFMRDLAAEKQLNNPLYQFIRENCMVIVIPVANPYGYNCNVTDDPVRYSGYFNANNCNINRNHDTPGWDYRIANGESQMVMGQYPASENETQYLDNTMVESGAVVAMSLHGGDRLDKYCLHQGQNPSPDGTGYVAYNQEKLERIAPFIATNYGFKLVCYDKTSQLAGLVVNTPDVTSKDPSFISQCGAYGGILELATNDPDVSGLERAIRGKVIEAAYAQVLNFTAMWLDDYMENSGT